ncbi:MAG TPA: hypothetical protein DCY12_11900 [Candidatus Atribacteria bacterium]|nr:hypothetical protein [Candidatus Atribacteria bacterium]
MVGEVSIGTILYKSYDLKTTLQSLKRCGVRYVDLDFLGHLSSQGETHLVHISEKDLDRPQEIKKMLDDFGLQSVTFSGHEDLSEEDNLEIFFKKMEFAKILGAKFIGAFSGSEFKKAEFFRNTELVAKKAEEVGITVSIETETRGDLLPTGTKAGEIIRTIGSPFIKFCYDFGNIYFVNQGRVDLLTDFEQSVEYVNNIHFKDPLIDGEGALTYGAIGSGLFNFKEIITLLGRYNRYFPVTIEIPYFHKSKNWEPFQVSHQVKSLEEIEEMVIQSLNFISALKA